MPLLDEDIDEFEGLLKKAKENRELLHSITAYIVKDGSHVGE
jgi:hypothetical protein